MKSAALNHKICECLVSFSYVKILYQIFTCGTSQCFDVWRIGLDSSHHLWKTGISFTQMWKLGTKCSYIIIYIEELESKAKPLQMGGFRECEEYVRIVHEIWLHAPISHACEMEWNSLHTNSLPIPRRLVPIIHIRWWVCKMWKLWFKNVFSCVRRFSTDLCQFYTSEKNHTSSSQTLYKFVPSGTEDVWNYSINFTASNPPSKFNIDKINVTLPKCALLVPIFTQIWN